jgi:hypothetical protein
VEGRANEQQLEEARIVSREHGLLRQGQSRGPKSEIRNYLVARSEADAPDIDGRVHVRSASGTQGAALPIGDFARVRIIGHTDYDLIAEPA